MGYVNKSELHKKILICFFPLLFQQLITNLLSIIDNFMLGRFSDSLIYCVSVSGKIVNIVSLFLLGLSSACAIFIAQYNGNNDKKRMQEVFRFSLISSFIVALPIIVMGFVNSDSIFRVFTKDTEIVLLGSNYLKLVLLSFIPSIISTNIFNSMRSIGILKPPLICNILVIVSKVILNVLFMYYPFNGGIYGAGLAYLGSRVIELIVMLILLKYQDCPFKTKVRDIFKFNISLAKTIGYKMLPLGVNELLWGIATASIYLAYSSYAKEVFAGYSIAMTYFEVFRILIGTFGMVITIIVSPYLARNQFEEARKIGKELLKISTYVSLLFASGLFLSRMSIPYIYQGSEISINTAKDLLLLMCFLFPLSILQGLFYFLFRAGGDNLSIYLTDSLHLFLVTIPILYVMVYLLKFNLFTVYVITELSYLIKCGTCILLLRKEKWLRNLTTRVE